MYDGRIEKNRKKELRGRRMGIEQKRARIRDMRKKIFIHSFHKNLTPDYTLPFIHCKNKKNPKSKCTPILLSQLIPRGCNLPFWPPRAAYHIGSSPTDPILPIPSPQVPPHTSVGSPIALSVLSVTILLFHPRRASFTPTSPHEHGSRTPPFF